MKIKLLKMNKLPNLEAGCNYYEYECSCCKSTTWVAVNTFKKYVKENYKVLCKDCETELVYTENFTTPPDKVKTVAKVKSDTVKPKPKKHVKTEEELAEEARLAYLKDRAEYSTKINENIYEKSFEPFTSMEEMILDYDLFKMEA